MKIKSIALLVLGFLFLLVSNQSAYANLWMKSYGGGEDESGNSIQATPDGGYIVAGGTGSFPSGVNTALWIVKLDKNGEVEWQKSYSDPGAGEEGVNAYIRVTSDKGYIVASSASSFGDFWKIWVVRLKKDGSVVWQKTYRTAPDHARAVSIEQTSDKGFILLGQVDNSASAEDLWLLKLDADGNVEWGTAYDAGASDFVHRLRKIPGGGYIVASSTRNGQAQIPSVWKLDADGNVIWHTAFCSTSSDAECEFEFYIPNSILLTSDEGYILTGYARGIPGVTVGPEDVWAAKLDADGNVVWQKIYGGTDIDTSHAAWETPDGNYIVAGKTYSFDVGGGDGLILKLDGDGNVLWQKTYGGGGGDGFTREILSSDEGFTVVGTSTSFHDPVSRDDDEVWVVKLDANGDCSGCPYIGTANLTEVDVDWKDMPQTLATRNLPGTVEVTDADVNATSGESLEVCYFGHDLAVTEITAPKSVTAASAVTESVIVEIQNRSSHDETVEEAALGNGTSTGLVRLSVSVEDDDGETCSAAIVSLDGAKNTKTFAKGAKVLKPKKKLKVYYQVTYDCTAALPKDTKDSTRGDYSHTATVYHDVLDGKADDHSKDDACPRSVTPPYEIDPLPDGTIKDKGCGAKKADGTLGAPVLTDVLSSF